MVARSILIASLLALALSACSGSSASQAPADAVVISPVAELPSPVATPPASATAVPSSTATPLPTATSQATFVATATLAPAATATTAASAASPPAAPAATAGDVLSYEPQQLEQGRVSVVYLNVPATAATLRFGGQQYAMLPDGSRWWAVVGVGAFANPGTAPLSVTYTPPGGTLTTVSGSIEIVKHAYPVENIDLDAQTSTLLAPSIVSAELAQRAQIYAGLTPQRLWSGAFVRPSKADVGDIYGIARGYNGSPATDYHRGTDFVAQTGDPITAAASGRVVFAGALKVRGNSVIVDHGAGVFSAYHHLSRIDVGEGQLVAPEQQVGLTGSTGLVTGPHLHWEVVVHGVEVDGLQWLQGAEMGP